MVLTRLFFPPRVEGCKEKPVVAKKKTNNYSSTLHLMRVVKKHYQAKTEVFLHC